MPIFPFDYKHYVGALRAKAGELKAVSQLTDPQREHFTPLWELQPMDDEDIDPASVPGALSTWLDGVAGKIYNAWGNAKCFIDSELLDSGALTATGQHPLQAACEALISKGGSPIPVASPHCSAASAAAAISIHQRHGTGMCVRLLTASATNLAIVQQFITTLGTPSDLDLVVDLEFVTEATLPLVMPFMPAILNQLSALYQWRTMTLLMGSFPEALSGLGQGYSIFPRPEWPAWRDLVTKPVGLQRKPACGDYAVQHPHFVVLPDVVPVAATIRYTGDADWHVFRGRVTSTVGRVVGYGFDQFHDLADQCRNTVPPYRGAHYSAGDAYIDECAQRACGTGNHTTWRFVGTSQHLVYMATDRVLSVP